MTMIAPDARDAWASLERTLRPYIARRVHASADVDDVLQDTMLRLHRGASTLRNEERFGPWVYRVAQRALIDHLRARARSPIASVDPVDEATSHDEERVLACRVDEHLALLVALLPEPYRSAVRATELEGMSQSEFARREGIALSTVKSRVQRGRARLRAMIEALCKVTVDARGHLVACDPRDDDGCCIASATRPRSDGLVTRAVRGVTSLP
jgi:RNA polymerase sigma-70 factor (ECF subfamily)